MLIGTIAGCRTADSPSPPAARDPRVALAEARGSCERGEPGGCERLELERARLSCEAGRAAGCEDYDIARSICLERPVGPLCDVMRRRGDLPPEPPPLDEAFGCHVTEGPIGPHAVVCLAEDRVSIRDAAGRWEQWQVASWKREDTHQRALWVATLVDGASLWLTTVEVEATGLACGAVVHRSTKRRAPRDVPPPPSTCKSNAFHVVGSQGLLRATLGAGDAEAEDALAQLPTVEDVCRHADACELAIMASHRDPTSDVEIGPPSDGPRTLQHCHARWWSAASTEQQLYRALPAACERIHDAMGGLPTLPPPYEWTPDDVW